MTGSDFNRDHPFGSARFAGPEEIARAGMFTQHPDSLFAGFFGNRLLWSTSLGGGLIVAGARSGKLRDLLSYSILHGVCAHSLVVLDMKGELAAISRDQTPDRKHCIYINPTGMHGLPQHRINPVDHLRANSPTLVSDIKVFASNMIPASGSANADYFEGRAREKLEAVALTLVKLQGVLTLPALYRALNLLIAGGDAWLDFAFEMSESEFEFVRRVETEIANGRGDSSGGFKGILGELMKGFACLSDPLLMSAVSPPYNFSLANLTSSDRAYQVYLMCPAEFVDAWAPVIKAIFVGAMAYKSRAPSAPRQTWILDECAQLGRFPLAVRLFTYGAGIGIRPVAVFQAAQQMRALGADADTIIPSSAATQWWFGVRDDVTATMLSRRIGEESLGYIDPQRQEEARQGRQRAALSIFQGRNPIQAGIELAHHARMARVPVLKQRALLSPDEILGLPADKMIVFADGVSHPILADRKAYYDQPFMAGRFHPNPYYPGPQDRVRVRLPNGSYGWRRIVTEAVPRAFADYPQYAGGTWSKVR